MLFGLLLTFALSGCSGVPATPKAAPPEQPRAVEPADKPSAISTPPAAPAVQPTWTYVGPGIATPLLRTGPEIILIFDQGGSDAWLSLDARGKTTAPPFSLGGQQAGALRHEHWRGSVTPDFSRILVQTGETEYKVIDRTGQTLWHGQLRQGKTGSNLYLLPDGKTLLTTVTNENEDGISTIATDLSDRVLWKLEGNQAGDLLYATDRSLILGNRAAIWRMGLDGKGRKDLPVGGRMGGRMAVSADGSTIASMRDKVGKLIDADGRLLAQLPAGETVDLSRDGQRVLVYLGKGAYALLDRQGRELWRLSFPAELSAHALSPDGTLFLAVSKSRTDESLLATLYDRTGKPVWQSKLAPIPDFPKAQVEAAIDAENRLAYVIADNRLFALPLQAP
jgi:outer membrane protein assembly factor BamB